MIYNLTRSYSGQLGGQQTDWQYRLRCYIINQLRLLQVHNTGGRQHLSDYLQASTDDITGGLRTSMNSVNKCQEERQFDKKHQIIAVLNLTCMCSVLCNVHVMYCCRFIK